MTKKLLDTVLKYGVAKSWKYHYFAFDMGDTVHIKRATHDVVAPSTSDLWETIVIKRKEEL